MEPRWLEYVKRVEAISRIGLTNCKNPYDIERYEELRSISIQLMDHYSGEEIERIEELFASDPGYKTPKVEVRGVVFKEGKILMVRELADNKWSLPGGYCEVGYSIGENVAREIAEEAGIKVVPSRLLGVFDRSKHAHPPSPYHVYKVFVECSITGEIEPRGLETDGVGFFGMEDLPELSVNRILREQIESMFEFMEDPDKAPLFD
jgi:ADP-ribose pyrophosphatase YjhB (NUDIX family)